MHKRHGRPSWLEEYGLPLLFFSAWSMVFSWPTLRYFTSHIVSSGGDARHNLWVLWHVKEAVLGRQPFWDLPDLYYPVGASLLTHGLGLVTGFLALPFWPWGPEAAHNGAVLLSLILTGYVMYLLARSLGLVRGVALFAGLFLLAAPMHLVGLHGHMTKVFMAGPPLALLCFLPALAPLRSRWWAAATGAALLLTLAHSGYQFVFTAVLLPLVTLLVFWQQGWAQWQPLLRRLASVGLASLIFVGPLLLAIKSASATEAVNVDHNLASLLYQPDAATLFLPSPGVSRFFGLAVEHLLQARQIEPTFETAIYLSWTGLLLAGVIWLRGNRWSRGWLLISIVFIILSLGPRLQLLGKNTFTEYQLPIMLPYALLTALPGLEFMRVPGRLMMVGYVAWGLTISMGLAWLIAQRPQWRRPILLAATVLLLVEFWPISWPVEALRPVPAFYQELAADEEMYGVLDLPIKPTPDTWDVAHSSFYQMYQIVHKKGIALGYISRTYDTHPVFPCLIPEFETTPGVLINGEPARCYENILYELAQSNYRYVVRHKPLHRDGDDTPGLWGDQQAADFINLFFPDQEPLVDDELVQVYAVPPLAEAEKTATAMMKLADGWHPWEDGFRWATSPAALSIWSSHPQPAILELVPEILYVPESIFGAEGRLYVSLDGGPERVVTVRQGETAAITLALTGGRQQVRLRLDSGNFIPFAMMGNEDRRELSFSLRSLNLKLLEKE